MHCLHVLRRVIPPLRGARHRISRNLLLDEPRQKLRSLVGRGKSPRLFSPNLLPTERIGSLFEGLANP